MAESRARKDSGNKLIILIFPSYRMWLMKTVPTIRKKPRKRSLKRRILGRKSNIIGTTLETRAANYYQRKNWKIEKKPKKIGHKQVDVYGEKENLSLKSYLLVECEDKTTVNTVDVEHFLIKVNDFVNNLNLPSFENPDVTAVLAYTGKIDNYTRKLGLEHNIRFKKF